MCGLVGIAGKIGVKEEKAFKDLLVVDVIRGPHSTGICAVDTKGDSVVYKDAVLPSEMFQQKGFKDLMLGHYNVLMGHNRWATQGEVNAENAHPFHIENIVGMHNGTLTQQYLLPDYREFEVDSKNIIHSLNKLGTKDTWANVGGAAALVWYDREKESLHFLRNNERSFFYCFSKDDKTLFWASEDWMLTSILSRNKIQHHKIISSVINREYVIDINFAMANKAEKIEFNKQMHTPPYKYVSSYVSYASESPSKPRHSVFGFTPTDVNEPYKSGTEVCFKLLDKLPANKHCDFYGFIKGDSSIEVEVYGAKDNYVSSLLSDTSWDFTGRINTYYRKNDKAYKVTIQGNSIKRVPKGNIIPLGGVVKKFQASSGIIELGEDSFKELVKDGCPYCGADDLLFNQNIYFDQDMEPVCGMCTSQPWILDLFN